MKPCAKPVELEALVAYWMRELPEAEEGRLDEHFFACGYCSQRLEWLAACAAGIRAAVHAGEIALVLTPAFLGAMKRLGLRVREYAAQPGETVNCSIRAEDDLVVSRLKAPLAGAIRVDAVKSVELGGKLERWRVEDVPFNEDTGEVLFMPSAPALRRMPSHTWRVQLVAVDGAGERPLGEYTFAHTAA